MKVPLEWLREYVDFRGTAEEAAKLLISGGTGVESIDRVALPGMRREDVLDLEITANRADLLSMKGVAREIALLARAGLREVKVEVAEAGTPVAELASVEVADAKLCPRYLARVVTGVKVAPSPDWMQRRLMAAGLRPINNIADITNYVQLECGEPLHAFDLALLGGKRIIVRKAKPGEKMVAIDGKAYELAGDMIVIADATHPVAIAGVMGGKESEISEKTRDVLIETAQFDPVSIRRASRRLGLSSPSSYRFERGVDWETVEWASRRAAQLMAELGGGKIARGAIDVAVAPPKPVSFAVRPERVKRVLGMEVPAARLSEIIKGLGCRVEGGKVSPPLMRRDLRGEIDVIEEVARIEGYDRIPTDLSFEQVVAADRRDDLVTGMARTSLAGLGCWEVLTWSFSAANPVDLWTQEPPVVLKNPVTGKVAWTLRTSLLPGLVGVLRLNEGYREKLRPIFEIAKVYFRGGAAYGEKTVIGIATPGGFAAAKGLVERLMEALQIPLTVVERPHGFLASGRSAAIMAGPRPLGCVGEPFAELRQDVQAAIGVAEIDFEALTELAKLDRHVVKFSTQPPVSRDAAILVDAGVTWEKIVGVIRGAAPATLETIEFVEEYSGRQVPAGKRSLTFTLVFRSPDRTLTGEEVDAAEKAVVGALSASLGAVRR